MSLNFVESVTEDFVIVLPCIVVLRSQRNEFFSQRRVKNKFVHATRAWCKFIPQESMSGDIVGPSFYLIIYATDMEIN